MNSDRLDAPRQQSHNLWVIAGEPTTLLVLMSAASVLVLVGTLALVPWLVCRLPSDYFSEQRRQPTIARFRWPILVAKNICGLLMIAAGLAMLVLPGQGLLTLFLGLVLTDFPGKFRIERWFVQRKRIAAALQWIRRRRGKTEFELPAATKG